MRAKLVQPKKALFSIDVTLDGIVMLVRLSQLSKANCPMIDKPSEKLMLDRFLQPSNAAEFIFFTLDGMVMLTNLVHPENAPSPMVVTVCGIILL